MTTSWLLRNIVPFWKSYIIVLSPLALLPLPLVINTPVIVHSYCFFSVKLIDYIWMQESKTGFVILLMSVYWVSSALPLAVTSLLPIVLFPLFDILSTNEVR